MTGYSDGLYQQAPFNGCAMGNFLKKIRNALLVSSALTGMLYVYYLLSGQADEIAGLWVYAIAMFFGVLGYLLFAARKPRRKHRK